MRFVKNNYKERGLTLEDRSKTCPYDFSYLDGETEKFIEVKGSQQDELPAIILTANEVRFARENLRRMELCVVHSIKVEDGELPITSGGILKFFSQVESRPLTTLRPIQYQCKLNSDLTSDFNRHRT